MFLPARSGTCLILRVGFVQRERNPASRVLPPCLLRNGREKKESRPFTSKKAEFLIGRRSKILYWKLRAGEIDVIHAHNGRTALFCGARDQSRAARTLCPHPAFSLTVPGVTARFEERLFHQQFTAGSHEMQVILSPFPKRPVAASRTDASAPLKMLR